MITCTNMTNHAQNDRKDRITYIQNTIGFGYAIIAEEVQTGGTVRQLTDSGVVLVRSLTKPDQPLVTAFVANMVQAIEIYRTATNKYDLPKYLKKMVQRNQRFRVNQPE